MSGVLRIILTALVVGAGMYFWFDARFDKEYDRAVGDVVLAYQDQVDSLNQRLELMSRARELQYRWDDKSAQAKDSVYTAMRLEIEFLRVRLKSMVKQTLNASELDPVEFYMSELGDSTFTSHVGDFDRPEIWRFAAEELGQLGKGAVGPLIARLKNPSSEYERHEVLYALVLLSGHREVVDVTGGESPADNRYTQYHGLPADEAWEKWWEKYHDKLE